MKINYKDLSQEALNNLIESFVLQEGTDYGMTEKSLSEKCQTVLRQLENGKASISFDPETQTCHIICN